MSYESERQTRKARIDSKLTKQGWTITPFDVNKPLSSYKSHAITEFQTANGPADYALVSNGRILALVEAKKVTLDPQNVLIQAQRYAAGVQQAQFEYGGFGVPFIYSTNGEIIWFQDLRKPNSASRKVATFHTPNGLEEYLTKDLDASLEWFTGNPNQHPLMRPYQIEANNAVENAICAGKRNMLLAMATGTGKTYTVVSQIYRLMRSGSAKRILFLVDRRALAAQAVLAFSTFEVEKGLKFDKCYEVYSQRFQKEDLDDDKFDVKVMPNKYLTDPQPGHAFVYVCTIQRMRVNLFGWKDAFEQNADDADDEGDASALNIPTHAFDVIIADECHRGYTAQEISKWREVLEHFDATQIGLTATPAAHTMAYFKDIVYRYDYERAVSEKYLVDWDAVSIKSNVRINGIFLKEGEMVGSVDPVTGHETPDYLEDEREFDTTKIEKEVTSPDSNEKIIKEISKYCLEHEKTYGRFPKTLIFAANDLPHTSHCDHLVKICRDTFGRGDAFVEKITGSSTVDRPLQRIRMFRNRPNPEIVVTRDMLTTGVDIPALEFLVFLRPVKSRILWEQMLGRGTRRCDAIGKSHFTVFDCFNGDLIKYFKGASNIEPMPPEKLTKPIKALIEDIYQNRDRNFNVRCLTKRFHRIDKELSGTAREQFSRFIPDGDLGNFAKVLPDRINDDFTETMKILRDPNFIDMVTNYPRPKRGFIVAYETKDTVSSEFIVRSPGGDYWKPEDYLVAFSRFIKENPEHIEAIRILLERPKDWSTDALSELRKKLRATKENFSEDNLRKAHKQQYNKELADIISMVKHAAKDDEPILTAEERVNRAFDRIMAGKSFSDVQNKWLDKIRAHLIENLTIDKRDFDSFPIFEREGGWPVANRVFGNELDDIIHQFNTEVAA